jgi:spermidine synthase
VIRWTELAAAAAPDGGRVSLMQRGAEFSIMIDGAELMNSRRGGSEVVLAVEACRRLRGDAAQLLIGGLGMGFTLRAALAELGACATVTVAELLPEVIDWARGPLASVFQGCLDDPRVRVVQGDVSLQITSRSSAFDAILLDVDNGPCGLVLPANDRLYSMDGLAAARRALRPDGVLAVWSASPDPTFARRLRSSAFEVEEATARSGGRRGARHVIYFATPTSPERRGRPKKAGQEAGRRLSCRAF